MRDITFVQIDDEPLQWVAMLDHQIIGYVSWSDQTIIVEVEGHYEHEREWVDVDPFQGTARDFLSHVRAAIDRYLDKPERPYEPRASIASWAEMPPSLRTEFDYQWEVVSFSGGKVIDIDPRKIAAGWAPVPEDEMTLEAREHAADNGLLLLRRLKDDERARRLIQETADMIKEYRDAVIPFFEANLPEKGIRFAGGYLEIGHGNGHTDK